MSDYSTELNIARKAADAATKIIQKYRVNNNFSVDFKGKHDLVTEADLKSEETIISTLKEEFPDDEIMAEETAQKKIIPEGRTWIIDPIDGTTNFAHGFPMYCVSIALWEDRKPKVGLVLEVSRQELFTAIAGEGAYQNGNPIRVSSVDKLDNAMIGTGFPYNDMSLVDDYVRFFQWLLEHSQGVRRPGAASYDLCCVAAGRFDGFYEYALNPWDVGAAALIVQEAGGKVSDWEGDDNWLFGKRIVAGNPAIQRQLLDAIREHFPADSLSL
ncbi:MAG TPA: inositol monophosphatase family protein [Balneolaceae bacterium]|nr:inositol monophosphatase family protein [Balneolaceae bacterium]